MWLINELPARQLMAHADLRARRTSTDIHVLEIIDTDAPAQKNEDMPLCTGDAWEVFPAYWAFQKTGFYTPLEWGLKQDNDFKDNLKIIAERAWILVRRGLSFAFLGLSFIWLIFFSICVFSYEMSLFEKGKAKGTEKESNIIIRLLDNVPWTAAMFRNVAILTVFLYRYPKVEKLTKQLLGLLHMLQATAHHTLLDVIACSNKILLLSWFILLLNFLLQMMYYFNVDFSNLTDTHIQWNFAPIQMKLYGGQVASCLFVFSFVPFFLAQMVLATVVGLSAGALRLIRLLNLSLHSVYTSEQKMRGTQHPEEVGFSTNPSRTEGRRAGELIGSLRAVHYKITQYIENIIHSFSEVFLVAVACDFAAAVGYIGLLIGRRSSDGTNHYFTPVYHIFATVTWMGFYLCGQYWHLITLPEEAAKTYVHVEAISFCKEVKRNEKSERELMHFLLATKDAHVGIVAGRLLFFSRHLSVTMITLLCSYGVLVYELLHREQPGAVELTSQLAKSIEDPLAAIAIANLTGYGFTRSLIEKLIEYQNMSMGAHSLS